jgi:hypothetical protein
MTARQSMFMVIMAALALGWASSAGAVTAAQTCEAAKLKASGNKARCLLKVEAGSVKSGTSPNTTRCVADFEAAFAAAELAAGGACPTEGDVNAIEALVDACVGDVAAALSGSLPPACQKFPATGQKTCWDSRENVISCAGTEQDGEIQAGATLSYTDNGDGTITDNNTGLVWEKQSGDGTIHGVGNTYTWENAFAVHVASLNTANFAGHNDWRLPNYKELTSILNLEKFNPAVSRVFNNNCVVGATVRTGSCTAASLYWSSTTNAINSVSAWGVDFSVGGVDASGKGRDDLHVRAVRGGSP